MPDDVVADLGSQGVVTGRSVATGVVEIGTFAPPNGAGVLMPAASVSLEHLATAKGDAFNVLYASLTRSVLTNLAGLYDAYAKTGDDRGVRAVAARELPQVMADKAALE